MKSTALIGEGGFVASNLLLKKHFDKCYNSKNIDSIKLSPNFDLTICAAAPGSMFEANRNPNLDRNRIEKLIKDLEKLKTQTFVLISSICVLSKYSSGQSESNKNFEAVIPYGRNRRKLELFCKDKFTNCYIIRLPSLFGKNLKKNLIFDILNPMPTFLTDERYQKLLQNTQSKLRDIIRSLYLYDTNLKVYQLDRNLFNFLEFRSEIEHEVVNLGLSAISFHNPKSTHQFYNLNRFWSDLELILDNDIREIHLATEPLTVGSIFEELLGFTMPEGGAVLHHEDIHTDHSSIWGKNGNYIEESSQVLIELKTLFKSEIQKSHD